MIWIKSLLAAVAFLGLWLWLVPFVVMGVEPVPAGGWQLPAGGLLIGAGAALSAATVFAFGKVGRGTPAPFDPPRRLVLVGPYRWVRNPMYLGLALMLLGEAVLFRSTALLALLALVLVLAHAFIVWYEERALERRFGDDYRAYRAAVHRWVPRPPARLID